jgi:hypothetical protein
MTHLAVSPVGFFALGILFTCVMCLVCFLALYIIEENQRSKRDTYTGEERRVK